MTCVMSSSSSVIANSVPLEWKRSIAYASQNVFRLVSSSAAVRDGGIIVGLVFQDRMSGTCGSQMLSPSGTQYRSASPLVNHTWSTKSEHVKHTTGQWSHVDPSANHPLLDSYGQLTGQSIPSMIEVIPAQDDNRCAKERPQSRFPAHCQRGHSHCKPENNPSPTIVASSWASLAYLACISPKESSRFSVRLHFS
jgi:hypothetical protein